MLKLALCRLQLGSIDALHSLPNAVLIEALLPNKELHKPLFICCDPLQGRNLIPPQDVGLCKCCQSSCTIPKEGTGIALDGGLPINELMTDTPVQRGWLRG